MMQDKKDMKPGKLSKLKMPSKKDEMMLDFGDEESAEAEGMGRGDLLEHDNSEGPDELPAKGESMELDAVSDEELMAEIKKRGLMSQLDSGESLEEDESSESMPA